MTENPTREQSPNWKDILKGEQSILRCGYVIPRSPGVVASYVYSAIFKTLTDREITDHQKGLVEQYFKKTNPNMISYLDTFLKKYDYIQKESGYAEEDEEALKQGLLASQAIFDQKQSFSVHYDYWQGVKRIGESISLTQIEGDDHKLLLTAPLDRIGQWAGFPVTLINRRKEYKPYSSSYGNPYQSIMEHVVSIGLDANTLTQDALNSTLDQHFYNLLWGRHYDLLDQLGYPLSPFSSERFERYQKNKALVHKLMYELLTDEEKAKIMVPRRHFVVTFPNFKAEAGNQKGNILMTITFGSHELTFDPSTGNMVGDLTNSESTSFNYEMSPVITALTTHESLLALRSKYAPVADRGGLTLPTQMNKNR
jgi:hypothetical protein